MRRQLQQRVIGHLVRATFLQSAVSSLILSDDDGGVASRKHIDIFIMVERAARAAARCKDARTPASDAGVMKLVSAA